MILTDGQALTPAQEQNSWPYKAVLATKGNQTIIGTIVLFLIARRPKNGPRVESTCTVDEAGLAWTFLTNRHGNYGLVCLGSIVDIRDDFRRLADFLKLDDGERVELFDELRKWVAIDMRADHDELATKH
jgi:hypothetical protein